MITLEEAKQKAAAMQAEGRQLIKDLNVEATLAKVGQVRVEGSFEYGLMVKPDIDIEVIVDEVRPEVIADLAKEFFLAQVERVNMVRRHWPKSLKPGFPNGIYMSLQHHVEGTKWNFDIWFHKLEDRVDPETFRPGWHEQLTEEQRDAILLLKYELSEQGNYPRSSTNLQSFGSAEVYKAVMLDGVKSLQDLLIWRKTHPHFKDN